MLSRIRAHFRQADLFANQIGREVHMLKRDHEKLIPFCFFDTHIRDHSNHVALVMRVTQKRALGVYHEKNRAGEREDFMAYAEHLPDSYVTLMQSWLGNEIDQMRKIVRQYEHNPLTGCRETYVPLILAYEDMHNDLERRRNVGVWCRPVAEMIDDFETSLSDRNLSRTSKAAAYFGDGARVLEFFQALRDMSDWKKYATRNKPQYPRKPRKREERQDERSVVWGGAAPQPI